MAGLTHLAVGLAAKRLTPKTHTLVLVLAAYAIDLIWMLFNLADKINLPMLERMNTKGWSHGLLMAIVWALIAGFAAFGIGRSKRTGMILGGLVFGHWVVDFISHPMTTAPDDMGMPVLLDTTQLIGLGLWRYPAWRYLGEFIPLALGIAVYILAVRQTQQEKASPDPIQG